MIPAPCTMQNLTTARAIVVQYDNEKLVSVYDNKVAEVKILFDYSGSNISKISVKKGAEILKQVEFSYGEGNILTARKKGSLIEKYLYNGVDYNIGGVQYSHHLLEGIVSEETKCAAQIVYVANSAQVETVRTGCIDSNGSFVEKSHSKFLFKKNIDKDAVIKK